VLRAIVSSGLIGCCVLMLPAVAIPHETLSLLMIACLLPGPLFVKPFCPGPSPIRTGSRGPLDRSSKLVGLPHRYCDSLVDGHDSRRHAFVRHGVSCRMRQPVPRSHGILVRGREKRAGAMLCGERGAQAYRIELLMYLSVSRRLRQRNSRCPTK
jgi:hypothetical protein